MAKARFPGTCQCGASVAAGASVSFKSSNGRFSIVRCGACAPDEHGASAPVAPPALELRLKIQRIRFTKPDGSWVIAEALLDGPLPATDHDLPIVVGVPFSIVGKLGTIKVGDLLEAYGSFENNANYGWQFKVSRAMPLVDGTDQALCAFMARLPQIGKRRAEKILQKLGSRAAVLEAFDKDPSRLCVVEGVTPARAEAMAKAYKDMGALRATVMWLASLELGEGLTAQIIDEYGEDARTIITEDPFVLMSLKGVGFTRADEVGQKLGVARDDPRRLAAATLQLLHAAEREGHTWSTLDQLLLIR